MALSTNDPMLNALEQLLQDKEIVVTEITPTTSIRPMWVNPINNNVMSTGSGPSRLRICLTIEVIGTKQGQPELLRILSGNRPDHFRTMRYTDLLLAFTKALEELEAVTITAKDIAANPEPGHNLCCDEDPTQFSQTFYLKE